MAWPQRPVKSRISETTGSWRRSGIQHVADRREAVRARSWFDHGIVGVRRGIGEFESRDRYRGCLGQIHVSLHALAIIMAKRSSDADLEKNARSSCRLTTPAATGFAPPLH